MNDIVLLTNKLLKVANPTDVQAASSQVTDEIYKIMYNLKVLENIKLIIANDLAQKKYELAMKKLTLEEQITAETLRAKGMTTNQKFKLVEAMACEQELSVDMCKNQFNFYANMSEVYKEWLMAYKKTISFDKL